MSLNKRADQLLSEIDKIYKQTKVNGRKQNKKLQEVRKEHPEKLDPNVKITRGCLHSGTAFKVPVQNWKKDTIFDNHNKVVQNIGQQHNKHSAAIYRNIPANLSKDEVDFIMEYRFKLAQNMIPIHHPNYELKPTMIEHQNLSHKPIWQEYW
ncbi:hypothetical protein TVAG_080180 [Trichomonas vaginalis G3]|uniref:Uncharacterized protein n=1 Tax=Trichomonas vaginalis (strain ATCC PRA-98 / G3) TaxID=412133 RepID=A2FBH1_TRIV3|nr:hypothetical protein TVAGG3_1006480 [Trichomonas vaginalis G3]EAX97758.1 hypothetical protein TVAG_080180 [Trichomonas vaginalis G3]KAI5491167.1 hypothetical protein TVAGG3_1006480 [Trichomonas vaginalis G3]|eukprot:XP_001310688.1 hypothetical protein [Trichomonas vaginalis G3]